MYCIQYSWNDKCDYYKMSSREPKNLSITMTLEDYAKYDWNARTIFWNRSQK